MNELFTISGCGSVKMPGEDSIRRLLFQTDNNLHVSVWGEEIALFTGKPSSMVLGKKYYEILPFIPLEGKDALAEVVRTGSAVTLKNHHMPCLFAHITADVDIVPVKSVYGSINAVKVSLLPSSTCTIAHAITHSRQMVDIRKITSMLAHGVRNPLNAIKGAVVYLRGKYAGEALLTEFTAIMEEEISRLEHFISRFLSSSVWPVDSSLTDINAILKNIEVLTSLQMRTRNIISTYELGNIPPIAVNPFHLEQAILNVLNNSFEAMEAGGQVLIRTYSETRGAGSLAIIEISDTGPGMAGAAAGLRRTRREQAGRGFGLFITQEILAHFRGHMEIENGTDRGARVRLCLPVMHPVEVADVDSRKSPDRR